MTRRVPASSDPAEPRFPRAFGAIAVPEAPQSNGEPHDPLDTDQPLPLDRPTLEQTASRLRSALVDLVGRFPDHAKTMGGMAAWLGVSKSSSQRLVEGIDPRRNAGGMLLRLPGTEALETIVESAGRLGVDPAIVARARAAVEQYTRLIQTHARSQRAFLELLKAGVGLDAPRLPTRSERRALHNAAVGVSGESLRVKSIVGCVMPSPRDPRLLRVATLVTLLGARRRTFARPLVASLLAGWWTRDGTGRLAPGAESQRSPVVPEARVVDRFCTAPVRPLPIVSADAHTALLIDFPDSPDAQGWLGPLDVCLWFMHEHTHNPLHDAGARLSAAARINQPTELLIHDVYLHRSIAGAVRPMPALVSMAALPGDLPGTVDRSLWFEQFPDESHIDRLVPGPRPRGSVLCEQHAQLAAHALECEGVNPEDFVGLRTIVEYPVWQLEYRMDFPVVARE